MTNRLIILSIAVMTLAAGCTFTRVKSFTPRTATEQLLVSTAFESAVRDVALPEVSGRAVVTKLAILGPGQEFWNDATFAQGVLEAAVARRGGRVVSKEEDADIVLTAIVGSLGTNGRHALFGLPELSLGVVVTPEIALLKVERQNAYARLRLVTRHRDGRLLAESAAVTRRADFNVYTVFFIAFRSSDIYDESAVGFE